MFDPDCPVCTTVTCAPNDFGYTISDVTTTTTTIIPIPPTPIPSPIPTGETLINMWFSYGVNGGQPTISLDTINNSGDAVDLICGTSGLTFAGIGSYYFPPLQVGTYMGGFYDYSSPMSSGNYLIGSQPSVLSSGVFWVVVDDNGIITEYTQLPTTC
jgi:hypothetical protein